ncbi:MAG: AraC family transcriptional regulator, partial [Proteobacteria bacterium]|nr:AraC family transcriptional regulator [Pseudomonadota bacterium]
MTELMRSAAMNGVPELARSLGLQVDALIAAAGIDPRALVDPEFRIPARAVAEMLELAAAKSGVETFAVRLAETRQVSITGPVGMLLREEATLGDAIRSLQKYLKVHNEAVVFHLDRVDD